MKEHRKNNKPSIGFGRGGKIELVRGDNTPVGSSLKKPAVVDDDLHLMLLGKSDEELHDLFNTLPMGDDGELLIFED